MPTCKPRGFTLVEVAVAMLVIAIGFTTVMTLFPVGMRWTREAVYKGAGMQNALRLARLAADCQEVLGAPGSLNLAGGIWAERRLPCAGKGTEAFDERLPDAGTAAFDRQRFPWLFELDGTFFTVEYRVQMPNGEWRGEGSVHPVSGQWTPAGSPFRLYRVMGDPAIANNDLYTDPRFTEKHAERYCLRHMDAEPDPLLRLPRLVHLRVTAYSSRPDGDATDPASAGAVFRRGRAGQIETMAWAMIPGGIP